MNFLKLMLMKEMQLGDRIKMAHTIKIQSASKRKVELKVSWYDVHGKNHTGQYSLEEGSKIEL